jgi:hypothetical protein
MKILGIFAILIACALNTSAQKTTINSLKGKWVSAEGSGLEVVDSSTIYLLYGDQKKKISRFNADFSRIPCWFDFTIEEGSEVHQVKSLLMVVHNDLLQWQVFDEAERPVHFSSDTGQMVYLRRKK